VGSGQGGSYSFLRVAVVPSGNRSIPIYHIREIFRRNKTKKLRCKKQQKLTGNILTTFSILMSA